MNLSNTTFGVYVGKTHIECLDVTFSSLAKYLPAGSKLFAVDNASGHSSYFSQKNVPVHSFSEQQSKLSVLNWMFQNCQTKYLVLMQSDVALFSNFLESFEPTHSIHADVVSKDTFQTESSFDFLDAVNPSLIILDVELLRSKGIDLFDDISDRVQNTVYQVGSWILKKAADAGIPAQRFEPASSDFMCFGFVSSFEAEPQPITDNEKQKLAEVLAVDAAFSNWGSSVFTQVPITVPVQPEAPTGEA